MPERDTGRERQRAQEEDYFRTRDRELIEEMRQQAKVQDERRLLGEALGVFDAEVLGELQMVGYSPDTIGLVELALPLRVAWADGSVSKRERDVILQIAARERVVYESPAHVQLNAWLDRRPGDAFFGSSLRAIQAMLRGLQPDVRGVLRRKLLDDCTAVAIASGGFLGSRKISDHEDLVLVLITGALEGLEDPAPPRHR